MLTTIPKLYPTFTVMFDFKPTQFQSEHTNVLHLTSTGQDHGYGGRVVAVYLLQKKSNLGATENYFSVSVAVNNIRQDFTAWALIPLNQWTTVEISQRLDGGSYIYRVKVNGTAVPAPFKINSGPTTWSNVKVYGSNNWNNAAEGVMRNLVIETEGKGWFV